MIKRTTYLAIALFFIGALLSASKAQDKKLTLGAGGSAAAPFSPSDIANLKVWLKSDQITGLNDGDSVSTWSDQSGNGFDVSNTGSNRPTYESDGGSTLNGLPVLRFNGTSQALTRTSFTNLSQPNTIFVVRKHLATPTGHEIDGDSVAVARNLVGVVAVTYAIFAGTVISGTSLTSTWKITEAVFNGASSALYVNGTSTLSGDAGSQALGGVLRIGGGDGGVSFFGGDMAEVLVYNADIGSTDRGRVRDYLNAKYAIF